MGIFQVADKGLNCARNIYAATKETDDGYILYRFKSCIDNFSYQFKETDPVTGQDVVKAFSVTEKRIASYNPALTRKQKARFGK